jgi:recombination protein RecT
VTAVAVVERESLDLRAPVRDPKTLRAVLATTYRQVAALLPQHMNEARFAALIMSCAQKDPKVLQCTGESILTAINQAASLGLEINSATGEAYLIPFNDRRKGVTVATLVPGYKGLTKLAIRSGTVAAIEARLVYDGEEFDVFYGTDSRIEHKPNFELERVPNSVRFAYAVAKMPSGVTTFEVMTRLQLDAIREGSSGKNQSPWLNHREEMYRKCPTRRLCKYLPMSPELAQAVELSDNFETGTTDTAPGVAALNAATEDPKPCSACNRTDGTHDPEKACYADPD